MHNRFRYSTQLEESDDEDCDGFVTDDDDHVHPLGWSSDEDDRDPGGESPPGPSHRRPVNASIELSPQKRVSVVPLRGRGVVPSMFVGESTVSERKTASTVLSGRSIALQFQRDCWVVSQGQAKNYVSVSHTDHLALKNLQVAKNRLNKFKTKVDPQLIMASVLGQPNACVPGCQKGCSGAFSLNDLVSFRASSFATASKETEVTEHLVALLRQNNNDLADKQRISYCLNGRPTCSVFWAKAYGASEDKMKTVRSMLRNKSTIARHGNLGKKAKAILSDRAHAFWFNFFDVNCQRPNDDLRLFPVNNSFKYIYDTYFHKWIEKLNGADDDEDNILSVPGFSTFKNARHHPEFKDVQKRPRHYHCLCKVCDALSCQRLKGFLNTAHQAAWDISFASHETDKLLWRKLEGARVDQVKGDPRNFVLIQYDDTSSLGVPKLSNRDIKNLTVSRFHVIPFNICNYASGESAYIYTIKNRYPKGGNRLCTTLYHILRKIKFGTHECRNARTLYLHADNASENKNNVFLTFLSELVHKGWYDRIILEFGPPGHTHNGRDAVHHIHNRIAGNFFSFTLGEFKSKWIHAWRKADTMPTAVVCDVQYDLAQRYEGFPTLSGHTNTKFDNKAVYAFKVERGTTNNIEIQWKSKPTDSKWLGVDHQVGTPGFVLLNRIPVPKFPNVIPANSHITKQVYINQTCGSAMRGVMLSHLTVEQTEFSLKWLRTSMSTGSMPYQEIPNQPEVTKADWGPKVEIGAPEASAEFYRMEADTNMDSFWDLPTDLRERNDTTNEQLRLARDLANGTPNLRYTSVAPDKARAVQAAARAMEQARALQLAADAMVEDGDVDNVMAIDEQVEVEEHKDEVEHEEELGRPVRHGPDAALCNEGEFAVVRREFSNGFGIELVKITKLMIGEVEGDEQFQASGWGPATGDSCSIKCCSRKWNPTRIKVIETHWCWSVLCYFKKLGKKSGIMPAEAKRAVIAAVAAAESDGDPVFSLVKELQAYASDSSSSETGSSEDDTDS
jgi:hypothetical protein